MVRSARPKIDVNTKEGELLLYIVNFVEEYGFQPSQLDMAEAMKVTKNAITKRLKTLQELGLIEMYTGRDRAIVLRGIKFQAYFVEGPVQ